MRIRNLVAVIILVPWLNGIQAINDTQPQSLKKQYQPTQEEQDELESIQATSFKIGVSKKTLAVLDQKGDKCFKAIMLTRQSIDKLPQKLCDAGKTLITKTAMGIGFLFSLAALYYFLGSHHALSSEKGREKNSATPKAPALLAGLVALGCGCFLLR